MSINAADLKVMKIMLEPYTGVLLCAALSFTYMIIGFPLDLRLCMSVRFFWERRALYIV